jgi:hypothetical protein
VWHLHPEPAHELARHLPASKYRDSCRRAITNNQAPASPLVAPRNEFRDANAAANVSAVKSGAASESIVRRAKNSNTERA